MAVEYWKQSNIIVADTSMTATMLTAPERLSIIQATPRVGTAVTHYTVDTNKP